MPLKFIATHATNEKGCGSGVDRAIRYTFHAIEQNNSPEIRGIVGIRKLPKRFSKKLAEHSQKHRFTGVIGHIVYYIRDNTRTAELIEYHPKSEVRYSKTDSTFIGLPAIVELETLKHLKSQGITRITTREVEKGSLKVPQMKRWGLEPNTEYSIDDWMKAVRRGIRYPTIAK